MRPLPVLPAVMLLVVAGLAVAPRAEAPREAPPPGQVPREETLAVHHVHGLGLDPEDPEVIVAATHTGLVRVRPGAPLEWVGQSRFDLMGFTAHPTEPTVLFASGHPDVQTYARERVGNLGLIASGDGGQTWRSVALGGHADFHALAYDPTDGGRLFGWSVAGQAGLYRISAKDWSVERLPAPGLADVLGLAASPDAGGPLLAGTAAGLRVSRDGGRLWRTVGGLPRRAVTAVAYDVADAKVAYAALQRGRGTLMRSDDGGARWRRTGFETERETAIVALAAGGAGHVALATTSADVMLSRDRGRTWTKVLERGRVSASGPEPTLPRAAGPDVRQPPPA